MVRIVLTLALIAVTAPAQAEGQRDSYLCESARTCLVGQPCTEGGVSFGLTFLGASIEITMNGETLTPVYDGAMRSTLWHSGDAAYGLVFTGDGSGVLTRAPLSGDFDGTAVSWLICSPS